MSGLAAMLVWMATTGPSRLVTPLTPRDASAERVLPGPALEPAASAVVEAARLSPGQAAVLMVTSLAISAALLAWAFWWWRAKTEGPAETAWRVLCRAMALSPAEREWVRRAAAARGVGASGLLVSVDALREAARGAGDEVGRSVGTRCGRGPRQDGNGTVQA